MRKPLLHAASFILILLLIYYPVSLKVSASPLIFSCIGVEEILPIECEILVKLYNTTSGTNWKNNTNWLTNNWPWYGVVVADGHVRELLLANNQLSGPLPSELGNLTKLNKLVLNNNQLTGTIPLELTNLTDLVELILRINQLTGVVPPQLGSMISLNYISLDGNQLTGEIPVELGNLVGLTTLGLSNNLLTGEIPPELGNLIGLNTLFLYRNQLTGTIPPELGGLEEMRWLDIGGNQLTGEIPPELGNMTRVIRLMLGNNQLTGSIPAWLGDMTSLWTISIAGNQFTGTIPPQLGNLPILQELDLASNHLTGSIPSELANSASLIDLRLNNNKLSGSIPPELGNRTGLLRLFLNSNLLAGDVPSTFVNLVNLVKPGQNWDGGDGLRLEYNSLNVPLGYPDLSDPLQVFLSEMEPDWHLYQGFEQVIGTDGGELTSLDNSTTIFIPEGTLDGETTFTFLPQSKPETESNNLKFAGNAFLLIAKDVLDNPITVFDPPLNVTISYSDADILGIPEETLALYYWDTVTSAWKDVVTTCPDGVYTRDMDGNILSLPICHLSEFGLFGSPFHIFLPFVVKR
jgi:Leucine-rich repeat (LRR) protein